MSGEDVANAMMALQMGTYASEKAVDPKLAAAMASTRRQNEMIVPGPQPPPPEHMADVYHRQQAVAALNVAGPGEKYQTRDPSHCAVRLIACATDPKSLSGILVEPLEAETRMISTHTPYALSLQGPIEDEGEAYRRQEKLLEAYAQYCDHLTSEFQEHRTASTTVTATGTGTTTATSKVEGDDKDDTGGNENIAVPMISVNNNKSSTSQPFFVVSFIPDCTSGSPDYTEPLLVVFAAAETEEEAEGYARDIAERVYTRLELVVVAGGVWIYPSLLGSTAAAGIHTIYPNAKTLESIVNSPFMHHNKSTEEMKAFISK